MYVLHYLAMTALVFLSACSQENKDSIEKKTPGPLPSKIASPSDSAKCDTLGELVFDDASLKSAAKNSLSKLTVTFHINGQALDCAYD